MSRPRGVQLDIVANLFIVMLSALALVAATIAGAALRLAEDAALERLQLGARHLERALQAGHRLGDLAALVSASGPRVVGGEFRVLDAAGRELRGGAGSAGALAGLDALREVARARGQAVARAGFPPGDLLLVVAVAPPRGPSGFLVGRVAGAELRRSLGSLPLSTLWLLAIATLVFVGFGSYLLRRRIVLPLRALAGATGRIADGDLESPVEVAGPAEVVELGNRLGAMARSLARQREALLQAQRSLSRSERLATVGQLAAGLAHEVGNPVTAILGYSEVLARDAQLGARSREMAERIRAEALRIQGLIREMLELSRGESLELGPVAPAELLERVARRLGPQPLLRGVELRVEVEPALPSIDVDAGRIERVLVNLVENAAHALEGQPERCIELRARRAWTPRQRGRRRHDPPGPSGPPDGVALEVIDTGPGIPEEHLPHVFDPFFTTKEPGKGTGLGLWNAHRIAELLGGTLEVSSSPGRTCFSLILSGSDTQPDARAADPDHR
jgi:signal transduction histidine kinase